jgi:light-regulated signal transduction histidine kinase (bacteriophytochrome)
MDLIVKSATHMGNLIDDLLEFSRMGRAGMIEMELDLGDLTRDVLRGFKREIGGRNVDWQVHALPCVTGDRAMLRIALSNLLSNALKFTRTRECAVIEIGTVESSPLENVIFVRDNGIGFDMQYADKLFGVFQRLHSSDEFEGTGIGLANVRRIVARHGGRTWAESSVDGGATFFFSLPRAA